MYTIEIKNSLELLRFEDLTEKTKDLILESIENVLDDYGSGLCITKFSNKTIIPKSILEQSIITIYKQSNE